MQLNDLEARARLIFQPGLAAMTVREALALMVRFYEGERVEGVDIDNDGDMLLVQWGPYAEHNGYTIDLVRQLIAAGQQDAEPTQLHLRCVITDEDVSDIAADNVWCDTPAVVPSFLGDVLGKDIIARAVGRYAWTIELEQC